MAVTVISGTFRLDLDPVREQMFLDELRSVRRRKHGPAAPGGIGADCEIEVRTGRRTRRYALYGRSVIEDTDRGRTWQFYFGLLLVEWLQLAAPPTP